MSKITFWTLPHITGLTLLLGCFLFLIGAVMPMTNSKGDPIYLLPQEGWLQVVNTLPTLWLWTTLLFISGTVVVFLGFALLSIVLRDAGDPVFSQLGLLSFGLGIVFLLINLAFRISIDFWAAEEVTKTAGTPDLYKPLTLWIGVLFDLYTVLVTFAALAYGVALVFTRALPRWIGWTNIVCPLALIGLFALTGDLPPFVHHLLPIVVSVALLLPRQKELKAPLHSPEHSHSSSMTGD